MSGTGSSATPFVIGTDLTTLLTAGPGITIDPSTGVISVRLSTNPANATTFGSDTGVFTFGGGGGPLAVCDTYFQTNGMGQICLKPGTLSLREVVTYNAPGNFVFQKADYPWLARVRVRVQAGGGGSAGSLSAASQSVWRAGAAGGGYSESLLSVSALAAAENIVVGVGGTAGVGNNPGLSGGDSSFGVLITALGGAGSAASMPTATVATSAAGTAGPAAGTGDLALGGGSGDGAIRLTASAGIAGEGGDSYLGQGGVARSNSGVGTVPRGYGGGAGGSANATATSTNGAAGTGGVVLLELYG